MTGIPFATLEEIRTSWPAVVDIPTAGRAFGIGRAKAYSLAAAGEFPVRILTLGARHVVPTADIVRLLEAA
jgi:hypothetical protein